MLKICVWFDIMFIHFYVNAYKTWILLQFMFLFIMFIIVFSLVMYLTMFKDTVYFNRHWSQTLKLPRLVNIYMWIYIYE